MSRTIILLFMCLFLTGCQSQVDIGQPIPADVKSVQDIAKLVEPHVREYWDDEEFHLGFIQMFLNSNQQGEVILEYADESSEHEPNVIVVTVNTAEHKIVSIKSIGSDSGANPGRMDFAEWKIDNVQAFEIVKKAYGYPAEFKPDSLYLNSNNMPSDPKGDEWLITFQDWKKNELHECSVNVYTGEITTKQTRKMDRGQTSPAP